MVSEEFVGREIIETFDVPPATNRGAQNTDDGGLRSLVDWVQGTFNSVNSPREIIDALGLKESNFKHVQKGLYGWAESLWFENIKIFFGGTTHPGCFLLMSGQACRQYEQHTSKGWIQTFKELLCLGGNFGRIDGAIDDFGLPVYRKRGAAERKPRFTVGTLIRKAKEGCVTSYFDHAKSIEKVKLADGESAGKSIYFGSPQSRVNMVCYEKIWERIAKGYDLEHGVDQWNRFEVRMYDDRAQEFIRAVVQEQKSFGELLCGVIKQYLNYRDKQEDDTNKSRWPIARFWKKFLGEVEKLQLAKAAPDKTLVRSYAWFERQVEPTMAELYIAMGDEQEFLNFVRRGVDKLGEASYERIVRDRNKLLDHIRTQKVLSLDEERANRLQSLKKRQPLDEFGQSLSDTLEMQRRADFEDFTKNYKGDNYLSDLSRFRKKKYLERQEQIKKARSAIAEQDGALSTSQY